MQKIKLLESQKRIKIIAVSIMNILRDYQIDLLNKIRNILAEDRNNRVIAVLPCRSGKSFVIKYIAENHLKKPNAVVWVVIHRKELKEQLENLLKDLSNCYVIMAQSIIHNFNKIPKPTMAIYDEVQHALANTWIKIINYTLPAYQIGFTATPCRTNGDGLGKIFNKLIVGVDCTYLLEHHFISDYDYYAPKLDLTFTKMKGNDYDQDAVAELMSENKIYTDVITSYLKYAKDKKTIMYCPTIKFSKDMVEQFNEHGIKAVHFDGSTSKSDRTKIYNDFKNGNIQVLSNVDLISEGVTISDCDCCLLLRPTQSLTLFIQQSMRCLTYAPNKKAIILDLVGNCYRHGLPTDSHEWTLEGKMKCKNPSGEKDILVRQCKNCFRVYKGTSPICPYCGFNNGKTKREIEIEEKAELEKIEHINKVKARMTVGMCKTRAQLEKIAKERGYKKGWVYYQCKVKNIPFK